jgi:lycopene beta-cyclase
MTYLQFLLIFIVAPSALLLALHGTVGLRATLTVTGLTALIALVYTTPWDHQLIAMDVWGYAPGRVIGTIWLIPYEEYAFFILQTLFTSVLTVLVLRRTLWKD